MSFVLDASVTAAWCFADGRYPVADAAFERLAHERAVVPALWWVEIRNVLIMGERRRRIDAAATAQFLSDLERMPIEAQGGPASEIVLALARRHKLTAYDAIYLELAGRLCVPLATLDARLAGAAEADDIPLVRA
ncbi:MAG: type II toxin-antitoxin system VapC family toxin [Proteobacteria bacterium]|nr:type II toxin-antitoxin system VapC family toxin [Pseudomonadota bacterium]